jgi:hypothetical protein
LGNLSTPKTVQKLQKALHAKAKAEAGYRFYALYDNMDFIMHLVQLGFGDGEAMRGELATQSRSL